MVAVVFFEEKKFWQFLFYKIKSGTNKILWRFFDRISYVEQKTDFYNGSFYEEQKILILVRDKLQLCTYFC